MPFLAYVAIILVSLGGILFEVNWLTSPKLENKPAVQASAAAPAKVAAATPAPASEPKSELNETVTEPKADASGPRNVAPSVTVVPGGAVAAKPTQTAEAQPAPTPMTATPASRTTKPEPEQAQTAAPQQVAAAPVTPPPANTNAAPETTGSGSTDFKREFSTAPGNANASTATFTPASTAPAATPVAAASSNKCDIAACSASYHSFRALDCSYQPFDGGARKFCDRGQSNAQQASAQPASVPLRGRMDTARTDMPRRPNKEAGLRAFEREVRRITADEASLDNGYGYDRGGRDYARGGRSQVIVVDRPDW